MTFARSLPRLVRPSTLGSSCTCGHRHERRRRPLHPRRGAGAPARCALARRRPPRGGGARRGNGSQTRAAGSSSAVRRLARRGALRAPPARGHPWSLLELARWFGAARSPRGRPPLGRHRSSTRRRTRGRAVPRRARPPAAGVAQGRRPRFSRSGRRSAISWRRRHRRGRSASPRPLRRWMRSRRQWPAPRPP